MENAYERKKQPELVRRGLLDHAQRLAVEEGLASLTIQAVADAAGVTKGGLFHHFPSKQALVEAMFVDVVEALDREIDALIAKDTERYGAFTRAYVDSCFMDRNREGGNLWSALSVSMISDPTLRAIWSRWQSQRLERHAETDSAIELEIVRLAADGVWLADLTAVEGRYSASRDETYVRLMAATRQTNKE
jgi:AcrR family transcriptional regulator